MKYWVNLSKKKNLKTKKLKNQKFIFFFMYIKKNSRTQNTFNIKKKNQVKKLTFMSSTKLYISCVADDELRVKTGEKDGATAQKLLSEDPRADPAVYWSPKWVREIVSHFAMNKQLQERYRSYINYLVWTAFRKPELPDHAELVIALKMLLAKWTVDCTRDETCLAPPSRRMLADTEIRKVLASYSKMKNAVEKAKTSKKIEDLDGIDIGELTKEVA